MGVLERQWWASVLGSLVAAAVMVVGPIVFLQQVLPDAAYLGESPTPDFLIAGVLAIVMFLFCLVLASAAVRGRRRARLRTEALHGNLDVMPVSLLVADARKAPDVSREPLVLSWRTNMTQRYNSAFVFLHLALFLGFILALAWVALIIEFVKDVTHVQEESLLLAGLLVGTVVYGLLMGILIRFLPTLYGKPFGLAASDDGIAYRTVFGRESLIRWEEMKLLEVEQYGWSSVASIREFSLYAEGAGHVATWTDRSPTLNSEFVPSGMSQAEMTVRLQALLHLINARTGLVPRTFSKALWTAEPQSAVSRGKAQDVGGGKGKPSRSREDAVASAVLAGITLALAAAVVFVPMSSLFILNIAVASSLIILAFILLVYALWLTFRRGTPDSPVLPAISFSDTPEIVYTLSFGRPLRHRLLMAILGLLMVVDVVPVLLIIVPSVRNVVLHVMAAKDSTASDPGAILPFVVAIYGVLGIMLFIAAFLPIKWTVRADRSALSQSSSMRYNSSIPWESIERITARVRRGKVVAYTVVGDVGRTSIFWYAEPSVVRHGAPTDGSTPMAPDQLAALVVLRSGKDIEAVRA